MNILANTGNLWFLAKILPLLALCALLFGIIGWWLRSLFGNRSTEVQAVAAAPENTGKDRIKRLEEKLRLAEIDSKTAKHDYESLQKNSVPRSTLEETQRELHSLQEIDSNHQKRIFALESDLKKAQASIGALNASANEGDRLVKEKTFALENELSKTREQLARFEGSTDQSSQLQAEIDRLRENLANANRVTGEIRRQEAATAAALAACEARLEKAGSEPISTPTIQPLIGAVAKSVPAPESDRVIAARAEVMRLNAEREAAQKSATPPRQIQPMFTAFEPAAALTDPVLTVPALGDKIAVASEIWGKRIGQDDLKLVEGIGPKIAELLHDAGINTWAALADTTVERIQEILEAAGDSYAMHDPSTWSRQAAMARDAKWSELKAWQDELDAGKE